MVGHTPEREIAAPRRGDSICCQLAGHSCLGPASRPGGLLQTLLRWNHQPRRVRNLVLCIPGDSMVCCVPRWYHHWPNGWQVLRDKRQTEGTRVTRKNGCRQLLDRRGGGARRGRCSSLRSLLPCGSPWWHGSP